MGWFLVSGGKKIEGEMRVQGAKNSVLPLLAATLLTQGETRLHRCPHITDVETALAILRHLGCQTRWEEDVICVDASNLTCRSIPEELMGSMRSSVMFLGPMIARCGVLDLCYPGGCELGPRPIDLHLSAMRELGVLVEEQNGVVHCRAGDLTGRDIYLSFPSVGATENIMLLAGACRGRVRIINAAREPEIVDLQEFLNALGMNVYGAGSSMITLEGRVQRRQADFCVMPDRIAALTYLGAAAITGGRLEMRDVRPMDMLAGLKVLEKMGCEMDVGETAVSLRSVGPLRGVPPIKTEPFPGFPTDAQAIFMALSCVARGTSVIVENVFESRFGHAQWLRRMGADLNVMGRVCVVSGVKELHGAPVRAGDLRAGAALTVAALCARGQSEITGIRHIDRGYEAMEDVLQALGADIRRQQPEGE